MGDPAKEGKAIAKRLTILENKNKAGLALPIRTSTGAVESYTQPAKYFVPDERDDYYETKARIVEDNQKYKLGTNVQITEEDIKYIQDQKTKEELKLYDEWFQNTYIMGSDPNKIALGKAMNPDWFKRREENIKREIDITRKLAKLSLRGPRNQEELDVMYALQTGRIEAPDLDNLFPSLRTTNQMLAYNDGKRVLQRGYFNPRNYTTDGRTITGSPLLSTAPIFNPRTARIQTPNNRTTELFVTPSSARRAP